MTFLAYFRARHVGDHFKPRVLGYVFASKLEDFLLLLPESLLL